MERMKATNRMGMNGPGGQFDNEPSRDIYIYDEINSRVAREVVEQLNSINEYDQVMMDTYRHYSPELITIYITSPGGEVYSGLSIISAIENSATPVTTIANGYCMSMAFVIYLAGMFRFTDKHCHFMWHDISSGMWGKLNEMKKEIKQMQNLQDQCVAYIAERTGLDKTFIVSKIETDDWYINPEDSVELGITHGVLPMGQEQMDNIMDEVFKAEFGVENQEDKTEQEQQDQSAEEKTKKPNKRS